MRGGGNVSYTIPSWTAKLPVLFPTAQSTCFAPVMGETQWEKRRNHQSQLICMESSKVSISVDLIIGGGGSPSNVMIPKVNQGTPRIHKLGLLSYWVNISRTTEELNGPVIHSTGVLHQLIRAMLLQDPPILVIRSHLRFLGCFRFIC